MQDSAGPRSAVVATALGLFQKHGYDQTSVEHIAKAAGVSRSTFFRQFGGKEDVVFADHEALLDDLRLFLSQPHHDARPHDDAPHDPWMAVCAASERVYSHFLRDPEMARLRYQIVRGVPALRDREIVTVFRYERLFDDHLRRALPGLDAMDAVGFAALVTAVHNHVLRRLLRGEQVPLSVLQDGLRDVRRRYGVGPDAGPAAPDDMVVAVFPRTMPIAEVTRRLQAGID